MIERIGYTTWTTNFTAKSASISGFRTLVSKVSIIWYAIVSRNNPANAHRSVDLHFFQLSSSADADDSNRIVANTDTNIAAI